MILLRIFFMFFFFNDTATTEIYTLSLHDALPICERWDAGRDGAGNHKQNGGNRPLEGKRETKGRARDRKSTRLNSSHGYISYAVFCLKKKKTNNKIATTQKISNVYT